MQLFTVHPVLMLNSQLAAKSLFSGLILGLGMGKREILFPFPYHLCYIASIDSTNRHFKNIVVLVARVQCKGCSSYVIWDCEVHISKYILSI